MLSREELEMVADLCKKHNVLCVSDEVYEWLVYPGSEHIKISESYHLTLGYGLNRMVASFQGS